MQPFNWTCPYCSYPSTITDPNFSGESMGVETNKSKLGEVCVHAEAVSCPNPECHELSLVIQLIRNQHPHAPSLVHHGNILNKWNLLPRSRAKPQPEHIPEQIRQDYMEACLICNDSPKASATLSRRCLQGIVRDFWEIPKNRRGNLGAEINYIKDKLDEDTWETISTIRNVGDIGAHMEKDVNIIVDVQPDEAGLLIELIETLLEDWYVDRHKRRERNAKTKALGEKKLVERRDAKKKAPAKKAVNTNALASLASTKGGTTGEG